MTEKNRVEDGTTNGVGDLAGDAARAKRTEREKFDAQKKVLQAATLATLERGVEAGLSAKDVKLLRDSLLVLGWLPADVRL